LDLAQIPAAGYSPVGSLRKEAAMRSRILLGAMGLSLVFFVGCAKDGETGPQGPQGLTGPEGPEGPSGPTGPGGTAGSVAFVFQDGGAPTAHYAGTQDTYISSQYPTRNYGNGLSYLAYYPGQIEVGHAPGSYVERGLLRFDLSEIVPLGGTVTSGYLVLYAASCGGEPTIGVYTLTQAWDEGTGDGTTDGYANWQNSLPWEAWTTVGGSFEPALLDSESMSLGFPKRSEIDALALELIHLGSEQILAEDVPKYCVFTIPASVVQHWIEEPDENYGFLLKSVDETIAWGDPGGGAALFTGREWTTGSQRPKLIVYYRLP
jgi:hypothetical protein